MIIYIKELDKNDKLNKLDKFPTFIKKIVINLIRKTNNFFTIKIDNEKQKIILPDINRKKVYEKIIKKINIIKERNRKKIKIVLSKKLHQKKEEFYGLRVVDGKNIFYKYIEDVIKKILGNNPIEIMDIYLLASQYTNTNVNLINSISKKFKSTNVITDEINKYGILEGLMEEKGIALTITNNKKKSLKKAKLIINLDFTNNQIRKYNISRNACIINLNDTIIENLKCFDGIIINNIEVEFPIEKEQEMKNNNLIENYYKIELYESLNLDEKNIKILGLYGNKGLISEKERLNVQNILTN